MDIDVSNVQIDSGLGYTNYMMWQDQDTTIKGANVTWLAENTTIATDTDGSPDQWTLEYQGEEVQAVRGTHLSITAIKTPSDGSVMLTFFQEEGNDMKMYQRDAYNHGGVWLQANEPVTSK